MNSERPALGRSIMVQGTASSVGKSVICAALCRIFAQDGYRAYPFKSQNMALNSFVTEDGGEMGRAQVVQAEACGLAPRVDMNPILLKPLGDTTAQVIIMGRPHANMTAREYFDFKPRLKALIEETYRRIQAENDIVVIEGAGSPAEINLNDGDFVNMGMARIADAPVILVGDIDRGGVFASLAGTLMLLDPEDRARVKGVIINKFRGDVDILRPGIERIEAITGVPVLGVVPHVELLLDDEDSVTDAFTKKAPPRDLRVGVINLPHMSNFTDFTPLLREPDVSLQYVRGPAGLDGLDLLVIPGSKNTIGDLEWVRQVGLEQAIVEYHRRGGVIFGICGGFQVLGARIDDPHGVEGEPRSAPGIGLLPVATVMETEKTTTRVEAEVAAAASPLLAHCAGMLIQGYEIHAGRAVYPAGAAGERGAGGTGGPSGCSPEGGRPGGGHFSRIRRRLGRALDAAGDLDGWVSGDGRVIGTYLHGVFENSLFLRGFLDGLRERKGLAPLDRPAGDYWRFKQEQYDLLAATIRRHVDIGRIYSIIFGPRSEARGPGTGGGVGPAGRGGGVGAGGGIE